MDTCISIWTSPWSCPKDGQGCVGSASGVGSGSGVEWQSFVFLYAQMLHWQVSNNRQDSEKEKKQIVCCPCVWRKILHYLRTAEISFRICIDVLHQTIQKEWVQEEKRASRNERQNQACYLVWFQKHSSTWHFLISLPKYKVYDWF